MSLHSIFMFFTFGVILTSVFTHLIKLQNDCVLDIRNQYECPGNYFKQCFKIYYNGEWGDNVITNRANCVYEKIKDEICRIGPLYNKAICVKAECYGIKYYEIWNNTRFTIVAQFSNYANRKFRAKCINEVLYPNTFINGIISKPTTMHKLFVYIITGKTIVTNYLGMRINTSYEGPNVAYGGPLYSWVNDMPAVGVITANGSSMRMINEYVCGHEVFHVLGLNANQENIKFLKNLRIVSLNEVIYDNKNYDGAIQDLWKFYKISRNDGYNNKTLYYSGPYVNKYMGHGFLKMADDSHIEYENYNTNLQRIINGNFLKSNYPQLEDYKLLLNLLCDLDYSVRGVCNVYGDDSRPCNATCDSVIKPKRLA